MRLSSRHFGCPLLALVALLGCASPNSTQPGTKPAPRTGRFMVAVNKSPFYKYGPAQAFGADFALNRGQLLTLVERSFGFSRVMTDDGQAGYMPTEDLVPAPQVAPLATPPSTGGRRRRSGGDGYYTGPIRKSAPPQRVEGAAPLFDVFDTPLPADPEPEKPVADSTPKPSASPPP